MRCAPSLHVRRSTPTLCVTRVKKDSWPLSGFSAAWMPCLSRRFWRRHRSHAVPRANVAGSQGSPFRRCARVEAVGTAALRLHAAGSRGRRLQRMRCSSAVNAAVSRLVAAAVARRSRPVVKVAPRSAVGAQLRSLPSRSLRITGRSTRTRTGSAPQAVWTSLRPAARCQCAPVNSNVSHHE